MLLYIDYSQLISVRVLITFGQIKKNQFAQFVVIFSLYKLLLYYYYIQF